MRIYSILALILLLIILIVSFMYVYAKSATEKNYIRAFNECQLQKERTLEETGSSTNEAKECFEQGGCYVFCGSGCGLPKTSLKFSEIFDIDLYLELNGRICPAVCKSGCLVAPI